MTIIRRTNRLLDAVPRSQLRLLGRSRSSFQVLGFTGLAAAALITQMLTDWTGQSNWLMTAVTAGCVGTFYLLAFSTKIITGVEQLVYYHHEIAVLTVTAALVAALGGPVLPFLDLTVIGLGTFLVFGRLGCLLVGCCHGRHQQWGVRYPKAMSTNGFRRELVGVRLLPTQLIESACVLLVVVIGCVMVVRGAPAGAVFAWYLVAYDLVRFTLEFFRGDDRPYYRGFSQAQWLALMLTLLVVGAELLGWLPWVGWHLAAAAAMLAVVGGLTLIRRYPSSRRDPFGRRLTNADIAELAAGLDRIGQGGQVAGTNGPGPGDDPIQIQLCRTSFDLTVSSGRTAEGTHYSLSAGHGLSNKSTLEIAALIQQIRHPDNRITILSRSAGIRHLIVDDAEPAINPVRSAAVR